MYKILKFLLTNKTIDLTSEEKYLLISFCLCDREYLTLVSYSMQNFIDSEGGLDTMFYSLVKHYSHVDSMKRQVRQIAAKYGCPKPYFSEIPFLFNSKAEYDRDRRDGQSVESWLGRLFKNERAGDDAGLIQSRCFATFTLGRPFLLSNRTLASEIWAREWFDPSCHMVFVKVARLSSAFGGASIFFHEVRVRPM